MNIVMLQGRLSSEPTLRELASGSRLWSLEISTDTGDGVASVPIAWFDPVDDPAWEAGTEVAVRGVVRRRFFRSAGVTQSRTEVVATEVHLVSKKRQVTKALAAAAAALQPR